MSKRRRILLAICVSSCAAALVGDFLAAQVMKRRYAVEWREAKARTHATEQSFRERSAMLHHALAPNSAAPTEWGGRRLLMITNSLGLRDGSNRIIEPRTDAPRVLFLGDSFVEGIGVEFGQSFVGLVAERLAKDGVEVLNGGVASYSPIIHYRLLRHLLEDIQLRFDELVVFVDVSDAQDEALYYRLDAQDNVVRRCDRVPRILELDRQARQDLRWFLFSTPESELTAAARSWGAGSWDQISSCEEAYLSGLAQLPLRVRARDYFENNSVLVWGLTGLLRSRKHPHPIEELLDPSSHHGLRGGWTWREDLFQAYGEEGAREMLRNLEQIRSIARERGILLRVAIYPWPHQLFVREPDRYRAMLGAWASERSVELIDYYPAFTRAPAEEVLADCYIEGDVHWNERGHRLIAEGYLEARGKRPSPEPRAPPPE